ncbi:hypothetical protein D3C80_2169340 [compost metagenome]
MQVDHQFGVVAQGLAHCGGLLDDALAADHGVDLEGVMALLLELARHLHAAGDG